MQIFLESNPWQNKVTKKGSHNSLFFAAQKHLSMSGASCASILRRISKATDRRKDRTTDFVFRKKIFVASHQKHPKTYPPISQTKNSAAKNISQVTTTNNCEVGKWDRTTKSPPDVIVLYIERTHIGDCM